MKRSIRPLCLLLVLLLGMLCVPPVALPAAALEERLGGDEIGYSGERVEAVEGLESIQDITVLANLTSDELSKVDAPYQITSAEGLRLFSELVNSGCLPDKGYRYEQRHRFCPDWQGGRLRRYV